MTVKSMSPRDPSRSIPWHDHSAIEAAVGAGPTFPQFLHGALFPGGDARTEGADLADWLLCHASVSGRSKTVLHQRLSQATCIQTSQVFDAATAACWEASRVGGKDGWTFAAAAILFDYFNACIGGQEAALRVAAEALVLNERPETTDGQARENAAVALGWLWFARTNCQDAGGADPRLWVADASKRIFGRITQASHDQPQTRSYAKAPAPSWPEELNYTSADISDAPDADAEDIGDELPEGEVVVLRSIGNPNTPDGGRVLKAFGSLVNASLPLVPLPDLEKLRRDLLEDYPHAHAAIDAILGEMVGQDYVQLPPIVLVGQPGAGKTQLAISLLSALGLPTLLYSCGGMSDGALGGTARRWSTGEPSTPAALMASHRIASPGIILDELDKPASGDLNGRLHDALLGMLEPLTAARWHDPYLEADLDLSHVVWIGTANSTDGLPGPLRDRCRILRLPLPGPEHLPVLVDALFRRVCRARNLDLRWFAPLDGMELRALASAWPGGSIRHLARLLDGVLAARNHAPVLN